MKKEDFCEILGDIDPKHVTTARSPAKRKTADKAKWYAVAACLCLIAGFLIFASGTKSQPNSSVVVSSSTADVAPMIFVNNKSTMLFRNLGTTHLETTKSSILD